jgi:hypothetical protein
VGAGNGFVRTWYDQSGNGRDATQATQANQPRIVNSGSVLTQNGKPAVFFNSSPTIQKLATSSFTAFNSGVTLAIVGGVTINSGSNSTFGGKTILNTPAPYDMRGSTYLLGHGSSAWSYSMTNGINVASGYSQWTFGASSSGLYAFRNGTNNSPGGVVVGYSDGGSPLVLGSRADGLTSLTGYIAEYIAFPTRLTTTDRQAMESNQRSYYGTP